MADKIVATTTGNSGLAQKNALRTRNWLKNRRMLKKLEEQLAEVQGNDPLVQISVDSTTISEVISGWTGIPTGRMLTDEITTVMNLDKPWASGSSARTMDYVPWPRPFRPPMPVLKIPPSPPECLCWSGQVE